MSHRFYEGQKKGAAEWTGKGSKLGSSEGTVVSSGVSLMAMYKNKRDAPPERFTGMNPRWFYRELALSMWGKLEKSPRF